MTLTPMEPTIAIDEDLFIYERVMEALGEVEAVREGHWPLTITVSEGIVSADGVVPSDGFRRAILLAIAAAPGVTRVINRLADDRTIELRLAAALTADPALRGLTESILVSSYRGQVTLTGHLMLEDQKDAAINLASQLAGVQGVIDCLTVE